MMTNKLLNKKMYKDRKKQQYLIRKKDTISKNNLNLEYEDEEKYENEEKCEDEKYFVVDDIVKNEYNNSFKIMLSKISNDKKILTKIIAYLNIKSDLTNTFFCECCSPEVVNNELKKYGYNIIYNGCGKCYCCMRGFEDF
jgi:hypothetical protein